jgi:glycosyltransferase involved in cell wall biosynthesis
MRRFDEVELVELPSTGASTLGGKMPRRVLIVTPYFPPSTVAGVHRARHLAKHLPAAGWEPTVLCVNEAYHTERLDPELAELLPKGMDIVKVSALSAARMRCFGIGDIGIRAYPYLSRAIRDIVRSRKSDVVMITGSPFYPFLLARQVKRLLKRPVVLDFQDPWVSRWGATCTPLTKAWAAHQVARWLEPIAVHSADFITSVSKGQNDEFAARYPNFPRDRLAAIPIGGDANDFTYLHTHPLAEREVIMPREAINISYVGTMLPRSEPVVSAVFSAVAKLVASDEQWVRRLQLNFVGTSNQPSGFGTFKIMALAERYGISDFVSETPQRVPYMQALDLLANSHALILIGSDEPHYTASKIYPALLSGRPIIALFHQASSAYEILQRSGGARVIGFDTHEKLRTMTDAIANALREIVLTPQTVGSIDRSVVAGYEASVIAARYAEIFDRLAS